ncbi:MAG: hypothetical protein M0R37_14845 [Bacteroidales bacterium]|nr:hypothetical protein [Bacteroidales bacterium]
MLTDLDFIAVGKEFPPKPERKRLADIESDRKLYGGEHADVFAEALRRIEKTNVWEHRSDSVILNWCEKVPLVFADLLAGEPGSIYATDTAKQEALDALTRDLKLMSSVHEGTVEIGAVGDCVVKLSLDGRKLMPVPAEFWFPVVDKRDTRNILRHVIAWVTNIGTKDKPVYQGYAEIHDPGSITEMTFDCKKASHVENVYRIERIASSTAISTGIDTPLVFHIPNPKRSVRQLHGPSDIGSMQSIVAELEVRFAGVSKVLDKHTDPTAYGPNAASETEDGAVYYETGGYIELPDKETPIPGYATWDGQLEANRWFIEKLVEQLYVDTETCPALFGRIDSGQGVTESASALKRLLIRPLAKVNRLRMAWNDAIPGIIATAAKLRNTDVGIIRVDWRDGVPDDPEETARTEELLRRCGVRSRKLSVATVTGYSGVELDREVAAITAEDTVEVPEMTLPGVV